jgi:hypothetical protein
MTKEALMSPAFDKRIPAALLILRFFLATFLLQWSIEKLILPGATARIQKSRPIDPVFRADTVVLAISAEKNGNLRVVYARIGRCQGRPA